MENILCDICDMKEMFIDALKSELAKGIDKLNTHEAGEVADIIKDLAETEKYCREAKYYETVTTAMEDTEQTRYGYNNRRYASGEYAPKGRGHMSGYRPMLDKEPYIDDYIQNPDFAERMRMGYDYGHTNMSNVPHERYGRAYNEYTQAKRHYTTSNSATDKEEMSKHAKEHISDTIASMRDIWEAADPELRRKMKSDLSSLVNEMNV